MERGRFIVIYGINNLGKTTQAKLLVERLKSLGRKAEYLKYPVYDLGPSGPDLDEYLRHANPKRLDAEQAQTLFAENRTQFEPTLKSKLANGIDIVAEDYWGTGLAWGIGAGADKGFLLKINRNFLREDLALLLVGKRFDSGKETNHLHEKDDELTKRVGAAHNELAKEFNWKIIEANQSIEKVGDDVWKEVKQIL